MPKPEPTELERFTQRRNNGRWTAAVGFAMLFGASILTALLVGGVLMVAYGAGTSLYWSWRIRRIKGDPWAYDPELDGPRYGAP